MVVAYDWAGSSNAFPDDKQKFDMIFDESTSGPGNQTLFKKWCDAPNNLAKEEALNKIASLVKDTKWFATYCGAVKNTIKVFCQKNEEVLLVCIEGGPITRVEAAEMPRLREEAMSDLQKLGVPSPSIEIRNVATFQEFEQLVESDRWQNSVLSIAQKSAEDKALEDVVLALIENAQNAKLAEGRQHI
jgi:hypothetical protein